MGGGTEALEGGGGGGGQGNKGHGITLRSSNFPPLLTRAITTLSSPEPSQHSPHQSHHNILLTRAITTLSSPEPSQHSPHQSHHNTLLTRAITTLSSPEPSQQCSMQLHPSQQPLATPTATPIPLTSFSLSVPQKLVPAM